MKINFYCEFPTKKSLEKLKLIKFPCKIFIAAKSIKEFESISKKAKKINKRIKTAYWPIVKNSYWISPFSNTKDLTELFQQLNKTNYDLLIDLEPPILNKKLFFNILNIRRNKKLIKSFMQKNKKRITTAQLPFPNSKVMRFFGLDYDINTEKNLMYYSSMIPKKLENKIKKSLLKIKDKKNYSIGLGTLAIGVLSNEPLLSPENLETDLQFVKKSCFNKVIIFRLGGLNNKYIRIINKFP